MSNVMNLSDSTPLLDRASLPQKLEPCYILRPLGYYLIILWVLGTSLNGSLLYIFIRDKKLRQTSTNIFIGGLIFADFLGACFEIPLPAIALINCRWIFTYVGCVFESIVAYFAGCSNMYMLCIISIDRYLVITKSFSARTITTKHSYQIALAVYMLALFWTLLPILGWSKYDYEGVGASCSIKWEERSFNVISYNIIICICVYLIPVVIIAITNVNIFKIVHQRRRCTNLNLNDANVRRQFLIERRIAHTVMFIIGGFLLAWSPYAISVFIRLGLDNSRYPPILGTIPSIFAKTSVVWNPLVYVIRNGNFRRHLPMGEHHRLERRKKTSEPTRFSMYPYSAVRLPLPTHSSIEEN